MSAREQRVCRLAEQAAAAEDPLQALEILVALQGEVEAMTGDAAGRLLHAGRSYADLSRVMGISRQAAHRRFRGVAPGRPVKRRKLAATEEARRLVRAACEEAVTGGAAALGSEHILVAALNGGGEAARALADEGVTLEATRACIRAIEPDRGRAPDRRGPRGRVRAVLREAVRVAEARGAERVDAAAMLVAALADPEGGARRVLAALGVDQAAVRTRLGCDPD